MSLFNKTFSQIRGASLIEYSLLLGLIALLALFGVAKAGNSFQQIVCSAHSAFGYVTGSDFTPECVPENIRNTIEFDGNIGIDTNGGFRSVYLPAGYTTDPTFLSDIGSPYPANKQISITYALEAGNTNFPGAIEICYLKNGLTTCSSESSISGIDYEKVGYRALLPEDIYNTWKMNLSIDTVDEKGNHHHYDIFITRPGIPVKENDPLYLSHLRWGNHPLEIPGIVRYFDTNPQPDGTGSVNDVLSNEFTISVGVPFRLTIALTSGKERFTHNDWYITPGYSIDGTMTYGLGDAPLMVPANATKIGYKINVQGLEQGALANIKMYAGSTDPNDAATYLINSHNVVRRVY